MRLSLVALAATVAIAPGVRAQQDRPAAVDLTGAPASAGPGRWYGWQVMLADLAAAGLIGAAAKIGDGSPAVALGVAGAATFVLAAPAIHLAHGSAADARSSFAVRTIPFLAGMALFAIAARHQDCAEGCTALLLPLAGAVGSGIGMLYDWVALSSERSPPLMLAPVPGPFGRGAGVVAAIRF